MGTLWVVLGAISLVALLYLGYRGVRGLTRKRS